MNLPRIITAAVVTTASLASTAQAAAPAAFVPTPPRLTASGTILYGHATCPTQCAIDATVQTKIKKKIRTIGTFKQGTEVSPGTTFTLTPVFRLKKSVDATLRKRLKKHRTVKVTFTVTVTGYSGPPVTSTATEKLSLYKDTVKKG